MGNRDKAPGDKNLASDGSLWSPSYSSQFHLGEKPQIAIRQKVCEPYNQAGHGKELKHLPLWKSNPSYPVHRESVLLKLFPFYSVQWT
jgi:hypothetical protein